MNLVFQHITESKICELITSALKSVTLYSPGVSRQIALSLANAVEKGVVVRFLTDISPYALRLGFFENEALCFLSELLNKNIGFKMYDIPGIRQGILVVDNRSWAFAVHSRLVEGINSSCWNFPNGLEFSQTEKTEGTSPLETTVITPDMLDNVIGVKSDVDFEIIDAEQIVKLEEELKQKDAEVKECKEQIAQQDEEIKQCKEQIAQQEEEIKKYKEISGHYEERCRLQKIEFRVQNYMIQNCSIRLKPELLIENQRHANRMKMTYALYEKGEHLPNVETNYVFQFRNGKEEVGSITLMKLQDEVEAVRAKFIYSLGVPYGNVILLDDKQDFEEAVERLETIGAALHIVLKEVLKQRAEKVLKELYQDLHQKGALIDDAERRFLDAMQDEIRQVSEKAFNLKCIKNCTIFQDKDYESAAFQTAVYEMLNKWCYQGKKPIRIFSDDVKIVYEPLKSMQNFWLEFNIKV